MRHGALPSILLATGIAVALAAPGVQAQVRDDLVIGVTVEPPHLDPTTHVAGSIREIVYANVYEGLTLTDENGQPYPALAESWEISEDGLTYTFHLREGVTFHDGTSFEASDVQFTYDRARGPDSQNAGVRLFSAIDSIETPDDRTVVIHLSRPDGSFIYNMGSADAAIVSPESVESLTTDPVGTGPFQFVEWVRGDRITLERYDDYWGDPAQLSEVTFRIITDPQAQVAALRTGEIDVFPNMGAPELLGEFEADDDFVVMLGFTEGEAILALNHRREPYSDVRVRQALTHAVDREAVIQGALAGYGQVIGSHYPPNLPDYVDYSGLYPYDPARAQELLAEAGYADGFEAQLILPPFPYARRAGEIIQAYYAQVGVDLSIEVYQGPQWLTDVFREFIYDMTVIAHTEPFDFGNYARDDWYIGYDNDEFDAVIEQYTLSNDPEERGELAREAQRILAEDAVVVFLFQLPKTGVARAGIEGLWLNSPVQANDVTEAYWAE
ncbi:MAG: ABC transporter substrate-binding protein [Azospirillaceae bacterium]